MLNEFGKQRYEEIPIPEELDQVLWNAMARVEREDRRKRVRKWIASAAAVLALCVTCANVTPVYAYAADLPVIGSIVRVFHIGTGGERTDGAQADSIRHSETVQLTFATADGPLEAAPVYTVEHLLAPDRVVVTLHGVRGMDISSIREDLLATQAVEDVYRTMTLDDSAAGLVVVPRSGWTYEVAEYAEPAALAISFTETGETTEEMVYSLRTAEMPYGEELARTEERFAAEHATQLKTDSGRYVVTVGQYATAAEAQQALRDLEARCGDTGLEIVGGRAQRPL